MDLNLSSAWVNRRGTKRTVPMQVLALGYIRTGTACEKFSITTQDPRVHFTPAMQQALEMLGYKDTHHMLTVLENPLETEMWTEAFEAKYLGKGEPYGREEWDQLLGHCQAVADNPSIQFAQELISAYPDAKVILTTRDPDKWWKSYTESLQTMHRLKRVNLAMWLEPNHFGRVMSFARMTTSALLGGSMLDVTEVQAKARFIAHYENVRSIVPKDRLLEYTVGQGWEPLCNFLGKSVPDAEFPWVNDTKSLRRNIDFWVQTIFRRTAKRLAIPMGLIVIALIAVCFKESK